MRIIQAKYFYYFFPNDSGMGGDMGNSSLKSGTCVVRVRRTRKNGNPASISSWVIFTQIIQVDWGKHSSMVRKWLSPILGCSIFCKSYGTNLLSYHFILQIHWYHWILSLATSQKMIKLKVGDNHSLKPGTIYCTTCTKNLICNIMGVKEQYVIGLKLGEKHFLSEDKTRWLVFLDANHCPGAGIIFLRSEKGLHLHTGDFRGAKCVERSVLELFTCVASRENVGPRK